MLQDSPSRWLYKRGTIGVQSDHLRQHPAVCSGHRQRHGDAGHRFWLDSFTGLTRHKTYTWLTCRYFIFTDIESYNEEVKSTVPVLVDLSVCMKTTGECTEAAEFVGLHWRRNNACRAGWCHHEAVERHWLAGRLRQSCWVPTERLCWLVGSCLLRD